MTQIFALEAVSKGCPSDNSRDPRQKPPGLIQWNRHQSEFFVYTIREVQVTFDPAKDAENLRKHGISLQRAEDFDVETALFTPENDRDFGEERWKAVGWLDARIYTLILVFQPAAIRAISLRKATREERRQYADA